jgi:hypothetical protein
MSKRYKSYGSVGVGDEVENAIIHKIYNPLQNGYSWYLFVILLPIFLIICGILLRSDHVIVLSSVVYESLFAIEDDNVLKFSNSIDTTSNSTLGNQTVLDVNPPPDTDDGSSSDTMVVVVMWFLLSIVILFYFMLLLCFLCRRPKKPQSQSLMANIFDETITSNSNSNNNNTLATSHP